MGRGSLFFLLGSGQKLLKTYPYSSTTPDQLEKQTALLVTHSILEHLPWPRPYAKSAYIHYFS